MIWYYIRIQVGYSITYRILVTYVVMILTKAHVCDERPINGAQVVNIGVKERYTKHAAPAKRMNMHKTIHSNCITLVIQYVF